ncbi:hypothetical protein Droror1_Dr00017616 [Drosera rotundifolia]
MKLMRNLDLDLRWFGERGRRGRRVWRRSSSLVIKDLRLDLFGDRLYAGFRVRNCCVLGVARGDSCVAEVALVLGVAALNESSMFGDDSTQLRPKMATSKC